ncbi:Uncharacterized conserved protein, DUF1800 family [Paraburkholderia caballeronis]|uniref:Uncharacterized conserved protein, DUF1800 family n=2 Tax=Paraburkholderia caballeronis TaxID=416943 RepID=A0A1H7JHM1_9BURK|nr:DUF1800 domain-containing protein [Paraburkholderia caballeronis]PXW27417.1 uncharacterized protein (DUF1800 family) [Paraburkholderia caballeronis]PXX02891.1 uncharacterized protein (DUF1800 family) [Paraburkholderia caballeronis]RAK03616.1 uncharacterized protein (DUF1800 family) [Paraburkholderia caballeronis]SEC30174.1 Uncharacterized conserved protein, DUF1800 family [Paraburkholderia caballeronis]SEK74168.1 Uncharacterized conserved protein, DUF1800 family [Paraburkholderia caballeron
MRRFSRVAPWRAATSRMAIAVLAAALFASIAVAATPARGSHRSGPARVVSDAPPLDADDVRYLLIRTGFAPDAQELAPYLGLTREQAVTRLLDTTRTDALTPLPAWASESPPDRAERSAWTPDQRREAQQQRRRRYDELRAWWIREMLVTPSPLTERMTLFWHNHFTSGEDKVGDPQLMAAQNALLRRDALGSFATLLHDVAKDPAMLLYLDGTGNRKGKPNENFARESMELFTLGEGRYSQQDVTEAARACTGWSVDPDTWRFVSKPGLHDDGDKVVLGQRGAFDCDQMLDVLLAQPQTARFIVMKLWGEFVSGAPDDAQIDAIATRFRTSGYDIRVALRALLLSPTFWDERNRGVLVSSPVEFVVGTLRRFDVVYGGTEPFAGTAAQLGERLFAPPGVKGWPGGDTWINSATLLARKQFVERLFRATEAGSPSAAPGMRRAAAAVSAGAMPRGLRFDLDAWLAPYRLTADAQPDLSAQLQMQRAVLPLEPADAIVIGASAGAYLEALLMDPVYQLK